MLIKYGSHSCNEINNSREEYIANYKAIFKVYMVGFLFSLLSFVWNRKMQDPRPLTIYTTTITTTKPKFPTNMENHMYVILSHSIFSLFLIAAIRIILDSSLFSQTNLNPLIPVLLLLYLHNIYPRHLKWSHSFVWNY